jgi:hypothetical protein
MTRRSDPLLPERRRDAMFLFCCLGTFLLLEYLYFFSDYVFRIVQYARIHRLFEGTNLINLVDGFMIRYPLVRSLQFQMYLSIKK